MRQVAHVLLTRPPLASLPKEIHSLDLHVLGTPPAFVLSQDQTLREEPHIPTWCPPTPDRISERRDVTLKTGAPVHHGTPNMTEEPTQTAKTTDQIGTKK